MNKGSFREVLLHALEFVHYLFLSVATSFEQEMCSTRSVVDHFGTKTSLTTDANFFRRKFPCAVVHLTLRLAPNVVGYK